jgi:hypothetical protein
MRWKREKVDVDLARLSGRGRYRFVNRADECARDSELEHVSDAAKQNNLCRQWFDGEADEVETDEKEADENAETRACASSPPASKARVNPSEEKRYDSVAENERAPTHVVMSAIMARDFHVRGLHQNAVPDESEEEHEHKRRDECDKEFCPVHGVVVANAGANRKIDIFYSRKLGRCP